MRIFAKFIYCKLTLYCENMKEDPSLKKVLESLGSPLTWKILRLLRNKALSFTKVAFILGKSPQSVYVKMQTLAKNGILIKKEDSYEINRELIDRVAKELKDITSKIT